MSWWAAACRDKGPLSQSRYVVTANDGHCLGLTLVEKRPFDTIRSMTKMVKEAIEAMRELSEEWQEMVARAILNYAAHDSEEIYQLDDDERGAVRVGLAS